MSPYIVTTRRLRRVSEGFHTEPYAISRRAVATLEEAQSVAHIAMQRVYGPNVFVPARWTLDLVGFPESGGTVGPLPDGTVIEVTKVTDFDLKVKALASPRTTTQEACDAFNARQS